MTEPGIEHIDMSSDHDLKDFGLTKDPGSEPANGLTTNTNPSGPAPPSDEPRKPSIISIQDDPIADLNDFLNGGNTDSLGTASATENQSISQQSAGIGSSLSPSADSVLETSAIPASTHDAHASLVSEITAGLPATGQDPVAASGPLAGASEVSSTVSAPAPESSLLHSTFPGSEVSSTAGVTVPKVEPPAFPISAPASSVSAGSLPTGASAIKTYPPAPAAVPSPASASYTNPATTTASYNNSTANNLYKKRRVEDAPIPSSTIPSAVPSTAPGSLYRPAPAYSQSYPYSKMAIPQASPPVPAAPPVPSNKRRLVILYDKLRFSHSKIQLEELQRVTPIGQLTIIELQELEDKKAALLAAAASAGASEGTAAAVAASTNGDSKSSAAATPVKTSPSPTIPPATTTTTTAPKTPYYQYLNICIEYNDEFENNCTSLGDFIQTNPSIFQKVPEIAYHIHFDYDKSWSDVNPEQREAYSKFLKVLNEVAGKQVLQCSIINKYELNTIYLTEKKDLSLLGQEIQDDLQHWTNLKVCDYGENFIRFFPGVKFPDTLEVLNIGGGYSLETLSGFKMPSRLKTLIASKGCITSIDNVNFPFTLERLELVDNKIYFLNYAQLPTSLLSLDLSQNRIDNLRGVIFPRNLRSLSLAANPIECIKGAKFPESLEYLDISFLPNESMTGVKLPDSLKELNLQQSMTNTRGLKLPPRLLGLNLAQNGVNSVNPLKLPNSIQSLHLGKNNIKTLNKVTFPMQLRELYLGDNLITTLKNIQFPPNLEILDMDMDPEWEEHEKYITTLKDVVLPPNLRVLKLKGHKIKSLESFDFPVYLEHLSLAFNELKIIRNIKLGKNLKTLDLSGNNELAGIDMLYVPESVIDLRIAEHQVNQLPAYVIERANQKLLTISVTPWKSYAGHDMLDRGY